MVMVVVVSDMAVVLEVPRYRCSLERWRAGGGEREGCGWRLTALSTDYGVRSMYVHMYVQYYNSIMFY